MQNPTVIDLFCGCGGMSWGLEKAGFNILVGIDSDETVLKTFSFNHPNSLAMQADLTNFDPKQLMIKLGLMQGDLDCIIGGPPCQGFSKNVPATYRFLEDSRNQLFRDYLHFVAIFRPKVVVMENVAEIYSAYSGEVRDEIIDILLELGYKVDVRIMFAPDYGVPQRRRRCIFFASRTGIIPRFPEPIFKPVATLFEKGYPSAWSAISDLPPLDNGGGYEPMPYELPIQNEYQAIMRKDSLIIYDHVTRKLADKQMLRISSIKPGEGIKDLPDELKPKSGYSGAYGRLDYEMLAPTITRWVFHPGSGRFCHPRDVRLLTIREAARLQSFSDEFRFLGTYIQKAHQVGNAVPPLLMQALAPNIKDCLMHDQVNQLKTPAVIFED
jgi:DNA (cytosine-5)-methyltransferase 1